MKDKTMSGTTAPTEAQAALASYDRMLAETRKFSAEQNKLAEEAGKLSAEARKLAAEGGKLRGDRWLSPVIAVASIIGAVSGSLAAVAALLRLAGHQ
jgi:hypothetical protein